MGNFWKSFLTALLGSVVVDLAILYILGPVVNNPAMPLTALTFVPVFTFTIAGVVAATIIYAILRAMLARPQTPFIVISIIAWLVSLVPDYLIIGMTTGHFAGATLPDALVLMLMHTVVAIITVVALVKMWGAKSPSSR